MTLGIYQRRRELIRLKFATGLTDSQQQELVSLNTKLDEIEMQSHQEDLSHLESRVRATEDLAEVFRKILESDRSDCQHRSSISGDELDGLPY